jgi:hypothetical protein
MKVIQSGSTDLCRKDRRLLMRNWVVLSVAAFTLSGWCIEKKEVPLLPADAIFAAYMTDATKDAKVLKQFGSAVREQLKNVDIPQEAEMEQEKILKQGADPVEVYLGMKSESVKWTLFSMGNLPRPKEGEERVMPNFSGVLCGTFDKEKVIKTLTQRLAAGKDGVTLEASQLNGVPVWKIKSEDNDDFPGFEPCMAFSGKNLLIFASNEKTLQNLFNLYSGKAPSLAKGAPLGRVLEVDPNRVSRIMLVGIKDLIKSQLTKEDLESFISDTANRDLLQSLCDLTVDTRLVDIGGAIEVAMSMDCIDEKSAQKLQELAIAAKVNLSMFVNMLAEKNPDLKVISQWIEKIRVGVIGKRATVAFKMTPQEIQKLNLKKSQVAKAEKTR